jgi:hypothetical protein
MKNDTEKNKASFNSNNRLSYLEKYDDIVLYKQLSNENNEKKDTDVHLNVGVKEKEEENKQTNLSTKARYFIYLFFSFVNIVVNMDSGNIPSAINQISTDLNIKKVQVGAFGSLVSFGPFVGGIISFTVINKLSRKWILLLCNLGIFACLFTFPISNNIYLLYVNRVIVGVFMVR